MIKKIVLIFAVLSAVSCSNNYNKGLLLGVWEQELKEEPEIEILGEARIDPTTGIIEETPVEEYAAKYPEVEPIIEGKHWVFKEDSIGMFLHGEGIYQKYKLNNDKIILTGVFKGFYNFKIIDSNNIELVGKEKIILKKVDIDPSIFSRLRLYEDDSGKN